MKPNVIERLHRETLAGGFSWNNQRVVFFTRLNALLDPAMTVVDFGAGRGKFAERESGFIRNLTRLKGKVARVIGLDIDPAVEGNPDVDEALRIEADRPLPLPDASVDLILSWAVFEHVEHPALCAAELARILKPGGWICAWTPNKWGYVALGSRLVPETMHNKALRQLMPLRHEQDTFPTFYRMNTLADIRRLFPGERFEDASYVFTGPPSYHGNRMLLARFWAFYNWLVPAPLGQSLHIFLRKR